VITRDGLVAEYLFNGNAHDTSGNGFHGVVQGATPAADRFGNPNSAYAFDGKDDWIVVAPPPRLTNVELTVSVWVRYNATKFEGWWHDCIICQDDGDDNDRSRRIFQLSTSGDWVCWHRMGEVPDLCSIEPVVPGVWYHLAAVFENGVHKLYVNGVLNASRRHRLGAHAEEPLHIGRKGTPETDFYFNGAIDDIRMYDRALGEAEIQSLLV